MTKPIGINPRLNCVFKTILGNPANTDLLLSFLNAILKPSIPFVSVTIVNPQHDPLVISGKETILDIKAEDAARGLFQIDMQSWNMTAMRGRAVLNNAELFTRQAQRSQDYARLRPAISIWLLDQNLIRDGKTFHHCFQLHDAQQGVPFSSLLQIHTLELDRWRKGIQAGASPEEKGWIEFFASAETWGKIPASLSSPPLEKAMSILKQFRNNEEWYRVYASEEEYVRVQATLAAAQERAEIDRQETQRLRQIIAVEKQFLEDGQRQLEAGQQQLEAGQQQLEAGQQQLEAGQQQLEAGQQQLEAGQQQLEAERQRVEAERRVLQAKEAELVELRALLKRLQGSSAG